MTNFERWNKYTESLPSPQSFVDWGFYYLISAALQRRVWCPPDWRRCYANMYVTFVGRAGIGKGQVIRSVSEILNYYLLSDVSRKVSDAQMQMVVDATATIDMKEAKEGDDKDPPKMIVVASDAVTYEALIQQMARCVRRVNYKQLNTVTGVEESKVASHSSLCFCLEELESLLREKTQSLRTFLIQAYDCGDKYEYRTKTQGMDRVKHICLNFLAATNPDFMQSTFDDRLLSSGYASRTFFIFATKNRKSVFFLPELTEEQKQHKLAIAEHVKKLYSLYGQIELEPETMAYLENWVAQVEKDPTINKSPKLEHFRSRLNIHVMKVAMAMHFGESLEMKISLDTFKKAIAFITTEMTRMHLALTMNQKNPLAGVADKILAHLKLTYNDGGKKFNELLAEFYGDVDKGKLQEILETLELLSKITTEQKMCPIEQAVRMFYSYIKEKE